MYKKVSSKTCLISLSKDQVILCLKDFHSRTYSFVESHAYDGMLMALVLPSAIAKLGYPTLG